MRLFLFKYAFMLLAVLCFSIMSFPSAAVDTEPTGTLPVIYINTENGKEVEHRSVYIKADMKIELDEENKQYENFYTEAFEPVEIRGRGNSTWGMPKKPYHIKLGKKASLFGMSESRHWILLANALDGTHLRNTLSFNLSRDLGLYSIKTIHIELVFNGRYAGLYQLAESIKIAPDRIAITDWEQLAEDIAASIAEKEKLGKDDAESLGLSMKNDLSWITSGIFDIYTVSDYYDIPSYDLTGGYLIELDEYYDEVSKFISANDVPIMIKEPEFLGTNREMFDYVKEYFGDMENALFSEDGYNEKKKHYTEYLDLKSFVDYWIVNQVFKSVELLYKSAFMYKDAGSPLVFGPVWDMDWSSGNHVNLFASSATYNEWQHSESQDREYWYRALYDDPFFVVSLQDRWFQIHDTIKKNIASIDTWHNKLRSAAAADNDIWGETDGWDFDTECTALEKWMVNRFYWMNEQLTRHDPDIMQMGMKQSEKIMLTIKDSEGYQLGSDKSAGVKNTDVYYIGSGMIYADAVLYDEAIKTIGIYINGIKKDVLTISGGNTSFEINTAELFLSDTGRRNVVLVIGRDSNGMLMDKCYITLGISGKSMRTVIFASGIGKSGTDRETEKYPVGAEFNLPAESIIREGYIFTGWTDGIKKYSAGEKYTVSEGEGDIFFNALWEDNRAENNGTDILYPAFFVTAGAVLIVLFSFYIYYLKKRKK